jgi:rRNA maturation RNase YbeY
MITLESKYDFQASLLEHAAKAALKHQKAAPRSNLSIVLTDNRRLRQLNRDYLGLDAATDVLSFPAAEQDPETGKSYLGDILISIHRAKNQAEHAGHTLNEELQLLVVHGFCTIGYDVPTAGSPVCGRRKARSWQTSVYPGLISQTNELTSFSIH